MIGNEILFGTVNSIST